MIRVVKTDKLDHFNRRYYIDENGRQYVDVNCNDENPSIYTISPVNGEPCWAIDCVVSEKTTSLIVVPADFEKEMKELREFYNIEEEENKRIQFKDSTGKPVELRDMFSHILK